MGGNDKLTLSFTVLYDNSKDVRTFTAQREEGSVQLSERLSKSFSFSTATLTGMSPWIHRR